MYAADLQFFLPGDLLFEEWLQRAISEQTDEEIFGNGDLENSINQKIQLSLAPEIPPAIRKSRPQKEIPLKKIEEQIPYVRDAFYTVKNSLNIHLGSPLIENSCGWINDTPHVCIILPGYYRWNQKHRYAILGEDGQEHQLREYHLRPPEPRSSNDPYIVIWTLDGLWEGHFKFWTQRGFNNSKEAQDFYAGKLTKTYESKRKRKK